MGEYIPASIEFGGRLREEKVDELLELINDKHLDPDWGSRGEVTREDLDEHSFFANPEVNYGNLDELTAFAEENGLHYRYWYDSGGEWEAHTTVYDPELEKHYEFVGGDAPALDKARVKELGSYEAVLAYFEAADGNLPALEIVP